MTNQDETTRDLSEELALLKGKYEELEEKYDEARRHAAYFDTLMARTDHTVVVIDGGGHIKYQSPNIFDISGWTVEEIMAAHGSMVVHPDDLQATMEKTIDALENPGKRIDYRYRSNNKDGGLRHVDATGINLLGDPDVEGILLMCADVTKYARLEEENGKLRQELRQLQKMDTIGTLAGGIAHDFNNILHIINGSAFVAKQTIPDEGIVSQCLENILSTTSRARDLVMQILTFSRKVEKKLIPLNLAPILREGIKLLRTTFPSHIEVETYIQNDAGYLLADPTMMHQVLFNLCTNAYQAMEEDGGVLTVTFGSFGPEDGNTLPNGLPPGETLHLQVKDTGAGMDGETLSRAFAPFFTTKKKEQGTGLGLSVVKGIVEEHEGTIRVESRPGDGAIFDLYFPRLDESSLADIHLDGKIDVEGTESILLVDDEEAIANLGATFLGNLGYSVRKCTSGARAIEIFSENPEGFDLVITDLNMPKMNGIEVTRTLLKIRPGIPVILTTGYAGDVIEGKAEQVGVHTIVQKPYGPYQIGKVIRGIFSP